MADPEVSEAADPEAEYSPEADPSEAPPAAPSPRPAASAPPRDAAAAKAEKRKEHLERALKASGRTLDGAPKPEEESDPDDEGEGDDEDAESDDAEKAAAKGKSEREQKLDKVKSHKHLAKALDRHKAEVRDLDERERKHREQQAKDDRINAAVTREYGPFAEARVAYRDRKDYRGAKAAIEGIFGDKFETIARNFYNVSKDGAATADLQQQVRELKEKLIERETKTAETEQATAKATETKQQRATFDKRIKGHELAATGDEELLTEAFEKWRASWDEDLGEYALSGKKAADFVLDKHRKRAEKLTGKRAAPRAGATRETRDPVGASKPLREMSKEEKRKYHLDRAMRQTNASRRERERHA